jgi:hypothetical protein
MVSHFNRHEDKQHENSEECLIFIEVLLIELLEKETQLMSALDDITTKLSSDVSAASDRVIAAIQAAGSGGTGEPTQAQLAALQAVDDSVNAITITPPTPTVAIAEGLFIPPVPPVPPIPPVPNDPSAPGY